MPELIIHGPFDVLYETNPKRRVKRVNRELGRRFWPECATHIQNKQGCYIFCMKNGNSYRPWYVGKAGKSFAQECFTDHKIGHYNEVLLDKKGYPCLIFVAPPGNRCVVAKPALNELERHLIRSALAKNPELRNIKGTKGHKYTIRGVTSRSPGKPSNEILIFKRMMGFKDDR